MCHCGLSDHKLIQQFVSPRNAVLQKETTANSRQTQSAICSWSDPHVQFTHVAWLSPQNSANAITQNELNTPFKKSLMLRYSSNSNARDHQTVNSSSRLSFAVLRPLAAGSWAELQATRAKPKPCTYSPGTTSAGAATQPAEPPTDKLTSANSWTMQQHIRVKSILNSIKAG